MKTLIHSIAIALVLPAVSMATELKGTPEELRSFLHPKDKLVSLQGKAEERAFSDQAIVSLSVTTKRKTLSEAITANSSIRQSVRSQLISVGFAKGDVNNSEFSSSPQYGWFGKKPSSYQSINRIAVMVKESNQLEQVAKIADAFPEVEVISTIFEHTRETEYLAKVKDMALDDVLSQKEIYEAKLGVTLTPVSFRESSVWFGGSEGAEVLEEIVVTATKRTSEDAYRADNGVQDTFDEIEYNARIIVDFKIDTNLSSGE